MVKQLVESNLEKLFKSIEESNVYKEYIQMKEILNKDLEIKELIDEIKELEKQATYLESIGDIKYKEIDLEIKKKTEMLNNKPVYQEYLNKMNELNDELAIATNMIEKYVEEKV